MTGGRKPKGIIRNNTVGIEPGPRRNIRGQRGERLRCMSCGDWTIEVDKRGEIVRVRPGVSLQMLRPNRNGYRRGMRREEVLELPLSYVPTRRRLTLEFWSTYTREAAVGIMWICRCGVYDRALPTAPPGLERISRRPVIRVCRGRLV